MERPIKRSPQTEVRFDADKLESDRQFSRNLARGLEVLRVFRPDDEVLGNSDICRRTGLAKATVSRLTYTLMLLGYLTPSPQNQGFRLGPGVLSLAHPLLAQMRIRQAIRPQMEALARRALCTVNLGMRDRLNVIYVDTCSGDAANQEFPDIGGVRPLIATAIGRALILSAQKRERAAIVNRLRLHDPAGFPHAEAVLAAEERRLAQEGYCCSQGDWMEHIHAVAVPLYRGSDGTSLALNCTTSVTSTDDRIKVVVAPMLLEAAKVISRTLCRQARGPGDGAPAQR